MMNDNSIPSNSNLGAVTTPATDVTTDVTTDDSFMTGAPGEHGHNVVTGEEAKTDAGATGLTTGAVVGGVIGAAVGGPLGSVIGGTAGSLLGGVAGDASEAPDESLAANPDVNVTNTDLNHTY